ncbi:hypothetical protein [Rhodococcus opacus]|uniref:hypothetical protein n=1 Tax=Rhodococcus opacus TaxID=37919 RepID=UPI001C7CF34E|nr:hypothetical protein FXW36_08735 [Rhodococcus opacus]
MLDDQFDDRKLRGQWVIERGPGVAGAHRLLGVAGVEGVDDEPRGEPATEPVTAPQRFLPAPPPPGQRPGTGDVLGCFDIEDRELLVLGVREVGQ